MYFLKEVIQRLCNQAAGLADALACVNYRKKQH
jgi:hypothetical protein